MLPDMAIEPNGPWGIDQTVLLTNAHASLLKKRTVILFPGKQSI